jgi:hypothetical protein
VDLERGPLSLVIITEEVLEWKSSCYGSTNTRLTVVGIRCADHATLSIRKKLALTSPISNGRSVGIVRLRTKATEFSFYRLNEENENHSFSRQIITNHFQLSKKKKGRRLEGLVRSVGVRHQI